MGRLVLDDDRRVCGFMADVMGQKGDTLSVTTAIGYERGGEIVAGVAFDGLTDNNIFAHIAARPGMFPVKLLVAVGNYVFNQLGLERMTFMVQERNERCLHLVEKLGAEVEGFIRRGTKDGDVLIFALWRDCRIGRRFVEMGKMSL